MRIGCDGADGADAESAPSHGRPVQTARHGGFSRDDALRAALQASGTAAVFRLSDRCLRDGRPELRNDFPAVACRLPFVVFIGVFNLFYDREPVFRIGTLAVTAGWVSFLSIVLRGLLSVQALLVLIGSTGYYGLCRSMQRLGVPAVFTTQLLFVYRYLYVLIEEAAAMQQARDARSFGRRSYPLKIWGTLVGQLLIRTFDRAEQISRAMLARGFSGRIPEGVFERPAWKMRDTLFLAVWCSAFVLLRLCRPAENLSMLINNL